MPRPPHSPPPTGITPDEAAMLTKRQEWRGRVLALVLDHLDETSGAADLPGSPLARYRELAPVVRRDAHRLLRTEMVIADLEASRHAANYFLDHLIVYIRGEEERRHREQGRPPLPPLASMSEEELAARLGAALERSGEAVEVFVHDLVRLQEFEIEVRQQRRRLQFLLGCDRELRDLAETNAVIIEASPEALSAIADDFFRICGLVRDQLPPLLDGGAAFPRLAEELAATRAQLGELVASSLDPLEALRRQVAAVEERLAPVVRELAGLDAALERLGSGPLAARWEASAPDRDLRQRALGSAVREVARRIETVMAARPLRRLEETMGEGRPDLEEEAVAAHAALQGLLEVLPELREALEPWAGASGEADPEIALPAARAAVRRALGEALRPAGQQVAAVRDANLLALKEGICHEMGVLRSTFLQPRFAHIAANDPRSTHTAQYFYLKEFAEEAQRSRQLLEFIHGLWLFIEELQLTRIEGLRFTPTNLNRIARRVLLERRAVPAGVGWRELAAFLAALKERLVPRLQVACTLPGIRYDDRNQLAAYADDLARNCSELLAQRETSWRLVQEIGLVAAKDGVPSDTHERYQEVVLGVTTEEMADKLRTISRTLRELLPYVGAMIGGIRMRTSLAFSREGGEPAESDLR